MLGDTAVAVHPDDARYKAMVGKKIMLPLIEREIPIIADPSVDPAFGSGAVKITPAHDFNDFQIGRRHNLPQISVMDTHGRMNEEAGPYQRHDARRLPASRWSRISRRSGLLEKMEPHQHAIGVCSRCETVVEPMLSDQWFVAREAAGRTRRSRRCATAARRSIRSSGRTPISVGWRTFTTGASRVNCGGAIASPRTGASAAAR